jgi:hypothetical protein
MKTLLYTTLIAISLTLMACPYEADVELNSYEESVKTDKKIIGEWVSFNEEGARTELVISKLQKAVLQVYHKQYNSSNKQEARESYRVYGTEVGEYTLFNIERKDGKYLFAKYAWTGKNEFYMELVDADYVEENFAETEVTTKILRAFITENVNKKELFGEKLEFYRKDSPEYHKVRTFMQKSGF